MYTHAYIMIMLSALLGMQAVQKTHTLPMTYNVWFSSGTKQTVSTLSLCMLSVCLYKLMIKIKERNNNFYKNGF